MAHKRTTTEKPARETSRKTSHAHATRHPKPRTASAAPRDESLFEPDDPTGRAAMSYWSGPREHGDGGSQLDAHGGHAGLAHGEIMSSEPDRHDGVERDH